MVQLKDVINGMVDKLSLFSREVRLRFCFRLIFLFSTSSSAFDFFCSVLVFMLSFPSALD